MNFFFLNFGLIDYWNLCGEKSQKTKSLDLLVKLCQRPWRLTSFTTQTNPKEYIPFCGQFKVPSLSTELQLNTTKRISRDFDCSKSNTKGKRSVCLDEISTFRTRDGRNTSQTTRWLYPTEKEEGRTNCLRTCSEVYSLKTFLEGRDRGDSTD